MSYKIKNAVAPAAWLVYLIIGIEIIYMISPLAIYYYSTYGPSLNFLHNQPQTAWLSGFFLPHYVETSSFLLNSYQIVGWVLVLVGFLFFLVGAGQIYYYKFTKKGAVTGWIYKIIRHPQYVAFSIMGFGLLLAWPRFTVLIMYVTMLFVYFFLAKKEEKECEEKFGESYKAYKVRTSMFIPGRFSFLSKLPALPESDFKRFALVLVLYAIVLTVSVSAAFGLRDYSLSKISTFYSENSATIAAAFMSKKDLDNTLRIALGNPDVQSPLKEARNSKDEKFLNYVVPLEWYLPDVPVEKIPEGFHGHHQPGDYNRDLYKILITKARLSTDKPVSGVNIIKNTFARIPVLLVKVNKAKGEIIGIETPPAHVRWGDIPTPLF